MRRPGNAILIAFIGLIFTFNILDAIDLRKKVSSLLEGLHAFSQSGRLIGTVHGTDKKKKPDNGPDLGILGSFGNLLDIFKPTEPAEPNKNPEPKATEEKKTEEPKQAGTGLLLKDIEIKPLANKKRDSKTIMAELQIFLTRLLSLDKTNPASKREAESLFSDFLGWLSNLLSEFGNTADSAFQELKLFYSDITSALLAGNLGEAMGRWFGKLEKSIFSYFGNIKTGLLDIGMLDFFSKLFGFSRIRSNRSLSGLLERGGNMFSLARPSELLDKRKTGSFSSRKSPNGFPSTLPACKK